MGGDQRGPSGAGDRDRHAVNVQAADVMSPKQGHDLAADHCADDTQHRVHKESLAALAHDPVRDVSGDQAENDPTDKAHAATPALLRGEKLLRRVGNPDPVAEQPVRAQQHVAV